MRAPSAARAMTGRTVGVVHGGAAARITWGLRRVGRRGRAAQNSRLRPGSDSGDDGVDLRVGQRSAGALREGRHRSSCNSSCGRGADGCIVGDGQKYWVAQCDGQSSLAVVTVASSAVLGIEDGEVHDLARCDYLRIHWRTDVAGRRKKDQCSSANRTMVHCPGSFPPGSSRIPDPSMPMRMANGIACEVKIRS